MNNIDHYWPPNIKSYSERWHGKKRRVECVKGGAPKIGVFFLHNAKTKLGNTLFTFEGKTLKACQSHYPLHPTFPTIKMEIETVSHFGYSF